MFVRLRVSEIMQSFISKFQRLHAIDLQQLGWMDGWTDG